METHKQLEVLFNKLLKLENKREEYLNTYIVTVDAEIKKTKEEIEEIQKKSKQENLSDFNKSLKKAINYQAKK